MRLRIVLFGLWLVAACTVDPGDPRGRECDATHPCVQGQACQVGRCVDLPGAIVPLYQLPTGPSWSTLIEVKQLHPSVPVFAVINPSSGPGPTEDPSFAPTIAQYVQLIGRLSAAGIDVLGVVYTGDGLRPAAEVREEVVRYRTSYPGLDGILFGQLPATPESYVRELGRIAEEQGFAAALGAGAASETAFDTLDAVIVYEGQGLPSSAQLEALPERGREQLGALAHGVSALDPAEVERVTARLGYLYVTERQEAPWEGVPSYLSELFSALAR